VARLADREHRLHSRYIEAASGGLIVGCLYLPNGNPAPGPKFDYKLRLFERLTCYSKSFGQRRAGSDLARNRKFESIPLQERVACEPQDD
jgi:exonuclease III